MWWRYGRGMSSHTSTLGRCKSSLMKTLFTKEAISSINVFSLVSVSVRGRGG